MILRAPAEADRAAFLRAVDAAREGLARFCPIHRAGEDDEALFRRMLLPNGGDGTGLCSRRYLGVLDDGTIAGGFNVLGVSSGLERKASINWWIVPERQGRSLATEGVIALADRALADAPPYGLGLGLHRVEAWITRDNPASIRVAQRAGFKPDSESPSYLRTGDRWVLHDLYIRRVDDLA